MIVDSHAHLKHGDAAATEYDAATVVEVMDEVGIDVTVVFAISTTTPDAIDRGRGAVARYPGRLVAYAFVDPSYDELLLPLLAAALAEEAFRGLKLHLGFGVPPPLTIEPFLELAAAAGVPALIDFAGRADVFSRLCGNCPQATIVPAHLGKYLCRDEALLDSFFDVAAAHDNVVLDASGVVVGHKIREAVERFGADRVMFGTDGPHREPDLYTFAGRALDQVRALGLSDHDEAQVLGGTAARLLGLAG